MMDEKSEPVNKISKFQNARHNAVSLFRPDLILKNNFAHVIKIVTKSRNTITIIQMGNGSIKPPFI